MRKRKKEESVIDLKKEAKRKKGNTKIYWLMQMAKKFLKNGGINEFSEN
ncbi:MAG TPA: hypothetical protein PLD27_12400 [bacterium]|nr:hypothetical protein [bacterium]HPQ19320.1 hypothetical protein [bacterium]